MVMVIISISFLFLLPNPNEIYNNIYIKYIELPVHKNDTVLLYVNLVSFSEYCLLYLTIGKGRGGKGRGGKGSAEGCIKLLNIIYDLM